MRQLALMTVDELAELLNVSVHHVRRLVFERRIPFLKIGSRVRFDTAEVEAWLSTLRVDTRVSKLGLVNTSPPRARSAQGVRGTKESRNGEH